MGTELLVSKVIVRFKSIKAGYSTSRVSMWSKFTCITLPPGYALLCWNIRDTWGFFLSWKLIIKHSSRLSEQFVLSREVPIKMAFPSRAVLLMKCRLVSFSKSIRDDWSRNKAPPYLAELWSKHPVPLNLTKDGMKSLTAQLEAVKEERMILTEENQQIRVRR